MSLLLLCPTSEQWAVEVEEDNNNSRLVLLPMAAIFPRALFFAVHSPTLSLTTVCGILIKCKQRINRGRGSGRGSSSAGFARDFLARLNLLIKERATVEGGGEGVGVVTGLATCHKFQLLPLTLSLSLAHTTAAAGANEGRAEEGRI